MKRIVQQKSFRKLNDFTKSAKKRLFSHNENTGELTLNARIPDRVLLSAARLIADGFNRYDARKPLPKNARRRAASYIKQYYAARAGRYSTEIRPRKANREVYAQATGLPKAFKVYPLQKQDKQATIKISGKGSKRKITIRNRNIVYNVYSFQKSKLKRKNTRASHFRDTINKIPRAQSFSLVFGNGYLDKAEQGSREKLEKRFNDIFNMYEAAPKFVTGIQAAEFIDQEEPEDAEIILRDHKRKAKMIKCKKCKKLHLKRLKRCPHCGYKRK